MHNLLQDLKLAFRNLRRLPQFTLPALVVLALGLGATAAMVGTLRTVFFTDPPFQNPQNIHSLWWTDREGRGFHMPASWPLYQELKARLRGVAAVEGISSLNLNLTGNGDPEIVMAGLVTPGFFNVFQTKPIMGSLFWAPDATRGAVLTEGLWTSRFGRDPNILGRTIYLNGEGHPILAVLPGTVRIRGSQVFVPLVPSNNQLGGRYNRFLPIFIRVAPGTGEAQIQAELDVLTRSMEAEHPKEQEATTRLTSKPLIQSRRDSYRTLGGILTLATVLLVLITLVNLANTMLARALAGAEDTALRVALGAGRIMAIRPRLMEAFLLSVGGAALGLGVAQVSLALLRPMVGKDLQAVRPLALDASLMGWTSLAALVVAVGMGGLPGLLLSRFRLGALLSASGRGLVRGGSKKLRMAMAVVQISLALTLLASFASLGGVLLRLTGTPIGLRAKGVAVFTCDTSTKTPEENRQADLKAMTLLERLRAVPGVTKAGSIAMLPVEDYGWNFKSEIHDRIMRDDEFVEMRTASPGLFEAFGIRLLAGRDYTSADMTSTAPIAIISQSMASNFWPGKDPLGQEFKGSEGRWTVVTGVVADVRNAGPASDAHQMTAYFPSPTGMTTTTFVVQYDNPRLLNLGTLRTATREVAPEWPAKGLRLMKDVVAGSLEDTATQVKLLGFAGGLALVLAMAGLYSLLAYLVAQRVQEFGLRASLGATPGHILVLVLRSGLWIGAIGIGVGLLGAFAAGRFLSTFLTDAKPSNASSLLWAGGTLLLGTIVASLLPALNAARIQPAEALRSE